MVYSKRFFVSYFFVALIAATQSNHANAQISIWLNTSGIPDPWYQNGINWSTPNRPTSTGTAQFQSAGVYDVWWNPTTQALSPTVGRIDINSGMVTFESQTSSQYQLQLTSASSSALDISGSSSQLTLRGLHLNVTGGGMIRNSGRMTIDGSHSGGSMLSVNSSAGLNVDGTLNVNAGGQANIKTLRVGHSNGTGFVHMNGNGSNITVDSLLLVGVNQAGFVNVNSGTQLVSSQSTTLGANTGGVGTINVSGATWDSSGSITVGSAGVGRVDVDTAAIVTNNSSVQLGTSSGSSGTVDVADAGSEFNSSSNMTVGLNGSGNLLVSNGGRVTNATAYVGRESGSSGTASVTGTNSSWQITGSLYVAGDFNAAGGNASLNITDGGSVTVTGTTKLWTGSSVDIDGGTFSFGQMNSDEYSQMNVDAGTLVGTVNFQGYNDASSIAHFNDAAIDVTGIQIKNSGVLFGNQNFSGSLTNLATGEIEVGTGERMRFGGAGSTNAGEINNFGGVVRFEQSLDNHSTGLIGGRGQFIADGGWTNDGVVAFSGGNADLLGDFVNQGSGRVVTAGNATTTFFDDVIHNGQEIHSAAGSNTVFFGGLSGAGDFTGTGTVFSLGDLRPGNSPGIVSHEGNLILGSTSATFIELSGISEGEFDQLLIDGDFGIAGSLSVQLLDGFELTHNQEFVFARVGGSLSGQFFGLGEGDLVGIFGNQKLYLSYVGGDGNDLSLFTAVPEPSMVPMLACVSIVLLRRRRPVSTSKTG